MSESQLTAAFLPAYDVSDAVATVAEADRGVAPESLGRRGDGAPGESDTEAILARWEAMPTGNEPLRSAP